MTRPPVAETVSGPDQTAQPRAGIRPAVTVFYDGTCPLCAAEIGFYRRRRGAESIDWIDASACSTETLTTGLTRDRALKRFHVLDANGQLVAGGQAFAVLWRALPGYDWLGRLFRVKPFAWTLDHAYDFFLRWRPQLQSLARRFAAPGR